MRIPLVFAAALLVGGCAQPIAVVTPSPSSPIPTATPTIATPAPTSSVSPTTVLMAGSFRSVAFPAPAGYPYVGQVLTDGTQAFAAFGDGSKSAYTLLDLATGTARTVPLTLTGDFGGPVALVNGQLGVLSWSRTSAGESYRYEIDDLASGTTRTLDTSEAPGHFHGEGSPEQADPALIVGQNAVAFVHLFVQGPDLVGELRVGPAAGPMKSVFTSKRPVRPVALSDTTLAYAVPSAEGSQLHVYDLASGRDRVVARGRLAAAVALGAGRLLYTVQPLDTEPGRAIVQDLATGNESVLVSGTCGSPSLDERYATVSCSDPNQATTAITIYELATLKRIEVARSTDVIVNARLSTGTITWDRFDRARPPALFIETLRY
jgi:hypothetical protein